MTYKIPPALNWLIKKRARLAGKIDKIKKQLTEVQPLIDEMAILEADLKGIDQALKLHDIKIDIALIKPVAPRPTKENRLFKFPTGESRKIVFDYIKSKNGSDPVLKSELIDLITSKHLEIDPTVMGRTKVSYYLTNVMSRMVRDGYVLRCHELVTREEGSWVLHPNHSTKNT